MIAVPLTNNQPVPTRWLIVGFLVCIGVFSIINLPSSLMGNYLINNGIQYQRISGNLWNSNVRNVVLAGERWSEIRLLPVKMSLLTGSPELEFDAISGGNSITGTVQNSGHGYFLLNNLSGSRAIRFNQRDVVFNSILSVNAERVDLNIQGTCLAGRFEFELQLPDAFQLRIPNRLPALRGEGNCQDGKISVLGQSQRDGIALALSGQIEASTNSLNLELTLPDTIAGNSNVINELTANGFERNGSVWHTSLEIIS